MSVPSEKDSIKRWRHRAAECRASAAYMSDETLRESLIATAKSYEAMAAHAAARIKELRQKSVEDDD